MKVSQNHFPTPLVTSRQASEPGEKPTDQALLFTRSQGQLERVKIVSQPTNPPRLIVLDGGSDPRYLVYQQKELVVVDRDGEEQCRLARPPGLKRAHYHQASDQILLHTSSGLQSHHPGSGQLLHQVNPNELDSVVYTNGPQPAAYHNGEVTIFSHELEPLTRCHPTFCPEKLELLEDGSLVLVGAHDLQLVGPEGESKVRLEGRFRQTRIKDGQLHALKDETHWLRMDCASGDSRLVDLGSKNEDLEVIDCDRVLVPEHHDYTRSTFRIVSAEEGQTGKFDLAGSNLTTLVSPDGEQAFIQCRQWHDKPAKQTLYRIDLKADDQLGWLGALADRVGLSRGPEIVYQEDSEKASRIALLESGQLAVAGPDHVNVLSPDGQVQERYSGLQEMIEQRDTKLAQKGPATLEDELRRTEGWPEFVSLEGALHQRGGYRTANGLEFRPQSQAPLEAYREMGYSREGLSELVTRASLKPGGRHSASFPAPARGQVEVVGDWEGDVVIATSEVDGQVLKTKMFLEDFAEVQAVAALRAGSRLLVAVGDQPGQVYLFEHGRSSRPIHRFRFDEPVHGFEVSQAGNLLAYSDSGTILCWQMDEHLVGGAEPSTAASSVANLDVLESTLRVGDFEVEIQD